MLLVGPLPPDLREFPHLADAQFESVRKTVGIFGGDAFRGFTAATPTEHVERIEAFDTYERGLIAHVQGLQTPVAEMKPAQPMPLRLKVNPYEGKEGENLHFWVREVELAMDEALIWTERLRVAFALSNLGGRAKTWVYIREATTPGCFTTWAQLCQQLRAAFLPANLRRERTSPQWSERSSSRWTRL
ncbi:Gag protein [Phytophthora palmivora]|uniref:Gag protein n=1 Tax=Phytophthora palmivora TaxID=4796 RepID=A0A2P4XGT8_9STRA|nr:Gag protein [Phytophthora palmivora]